MTPALALVQAVREAVGFEAQAAPLGNLTWGRGTFEGRPVRLAIVESRLAGGSIGQREAERLAALFKVAAVERSALLLCLDTAGARVSEGLQALGAFRALIRAGLDAQLAGAPLAAVLGRHCFGGGSMLAYLCRRRLASPETQLAMSGPASLAASAGVPATDEMFRAMAQAALSAESRAATDGANGVWSPGSDVRPWLREALLPAEPLAVMSACHARHRQLGTRLGSAASPRPAEAVRRRDLEKLYPAGYDVREQDGLLEGQATGDRGPEAILGLLGHQPVGNARAWRFADRAWAHVERPPARLEVYLDCATHAPRLDDERAILTEYVMDMSIALRALAARGCVVGLTVVGKAGGGVYAALAAPASRVAAVHGADIQLLPGAAIAAILGESRDSAPAFAEYAAARVADHELKLGLVP